MTKVKRDSCPDSIDEWLDRKLEQCRRAYFVGGVKGALKDVVYYCDEHHRSLPEWAKIELNDLMNSSLSGYVGTKIGRHAKWIDQYRQDMIDFARADCVQDCIERGFSWNGVYIIAMEALKGTPAEAKSEHTIEKSYKRYKQRSAECPERYYLLHTLPLNMNTGFSKEWIDFLDSPQAKIKTARVRKSPS